MFKNIRSLLILLTAMMIITVCFCVSFADSTRDEAGDTTPPEAVTTEILTTHVKAGDPVKIRFKIREEETGLSRIYVQLKPCVNGSTQTIDANVEFDSPLFSSSDDLITYTVSVPTSEDNLSGEWEISDVILQDYKGNFVQGEYFGTQYIGSSTFTIYGSSSGTTQPTINSISCLTPEFQKPGTLKLRLNVTSSNPLSSIQLDFTVGKKDITKFVNTIQQKTGTYTIDISVPFDKNSRTGSYKLWNLFLYDTAGFSSGYSTELGNGYFINSDNPDDKFNIIRFNVTGPPGEDETDPDFTDITVHADSAVVYKPGVLTFDIYISEADSGLVFFVMHIGPPGEESYSTLRQMNYSFYTKGVMEEPAGFSSNNLNYNYILSEPLKSGKHTFSVPIKSEMKSGDYKMEIHFMEDAAGNRQNVSSDDPRVAYFTVKDEFDYAFEVSASNPNILSKVQGMEDGKTGRIMLEKKASNNVIRKEVLDAIAGTNKKLVCYKDAYQWIIDGEKISLDKTKDLNVDVKISTVSADYLSSGEQALCLTFGDNGELPGPIQFRFKTDYVKAYANNTGALHLYYVNEGNVASSGGDVTDDRPIDYINSDYEDVQNANLQVIPDVDDNWCYVDISHNSKYLLSKSKLSRLTMKRAKVKGLAESYAYTGKAIRPNPKVVLADKTLRKGIDYKVTYKNNKKIGKAKMIIKGVGIKGTKTVTFRIVPKGTTIKDIKPSKKSYTVKWKRQAKQTTGYQIQYSTSKKFTKKTTKTVTIKKNKTVKTTVKKLKANKTYYVRIRTYKKVSGKMYYSTWSKARKVKIKK